MRLLLAFIHSKWKFWRERLKDSQTSNTYVIKLFHLCHSHCYFILISTFHLYFALKLYTLVTRCSSRNYCKFRWSDPAFLSCEHTRWVIGCTCTLYKFYTSVQIVGPITPWNGIMRTPVCTSSALLLSLRMLRELLWAGLIFENKISMLFHNPIIVFEFLIYM